MRAKLRLQAEGVGVGYLPSLCAQGLVDAGLLVRKRVEREREAERLSVAWRAGTPGKGLAWWIARLTDPQAFEGLLASAQRLYAAGSLPSGR
jgi:DNA-binding transcriptional LysR family regulator